MKRLLVFILLLKAFSSYAAERRYLTYEQWSNVIEDLQSLYSHYLRPAGIDFQILPSWESSDANGTVDRNRNSWFVFVYAGYTLSPYVTEDVIARVVCHEIGHHMGGTNFYPSPYSWSASEGQADYYSTLKCLRRYFEHKDNVGAIKKLKVPAIVSQKCNEVWGTEEDRAVCIRSSMASYAWSMVMRPDSKVDFSTPDKSMVESSIYSMPGIQCRLDTHFQGALCLEDKSIETSSSDFKQGTCNEDRYDIGLRPKCWYRP